MCWTSTREDVARRIRPARIARHLRRLAEGCEGRAEHRRGDVVGHVGDVGAQRSQGTAQDGCARGPVGFRGPRGDDEAGCDDDASGPLQRVRRTRGAARLEEFFNAPPARIESEEVVDGIFSKVWQGGCSIAGRRPVMQRLLVVVALAVATEGCSTAPLLRRQSFAFVSIQEADEAKGMPTRTPWPPWWTASASPAVTRMSSATPDLFDRPATGHVFKRIIKGGPINKSEAGTRLPRVPRRLHHRHREGCRWPGGRRPHSYSLSWRLVEDELVGRQRRATMPGEAAIVRVDQHAPVGGDRRPRP